MDPDVFPNSIEHGARPAWSFPQRPGTLDAAEGQQQPGDCRGTSGCERRPGYANRVELRRTSGAVPDARHHRCLQSTGRTGATCAAGALRVIKWDDMLDDGIDLSGDATGWGLNLSSNLNFGKDVVRLHVFGEGIQNYMNDAPVDIGVKNNFQDPLASPRRGAAHPGPRGLHRLRVHPTSIQHLRLLPHGHRQQRWTGAECVRAVSILSATSCTIRRRT